MLTPLNINKNIAISQLSNLNLIVSTPLQTMVIEQPQMQAIILQLLETPLDMMQLIDKLADKYPQMELMRTLNTLKHYQIINAAQQPPAFELHNHFSAMAAHNASDMPFKFIDFEQNSLVAHFESNGHGPAAAGFPVMLVNDILDQRLDAFQQTQFSAEQPFIVAQVTGTELLISPVIDPCKSPCWACMAYRLKLHRPMQALLQSAKQIQTAQADFCAQAVNVIRKVLSAQIEPLHRSDDSSNQSSDEQSHDLVKLNLTNGETSHHRVSRRPQCPCCGDPDQKVDYHKLSLLADNSTVANDAGGYRTVSAKLTYQKYQHLVDPLTGIMASVDEYRKVPGAPIYNYCSGRNIALQSRSLFWLNNHMRSSSGGKGANEQQAKTGALCESVERYSMVYHGQEACTTASYSELASKAIHPNTCMNFSHKQITERESINKHSSAFHTLVPIDFDENAQLDWTGTYSLIDQQIRYLPSAFCFAQYPAADENQLLAYPDSNGCAAGNNHAEAILQGTFELIERDAAAIWWYNRINRPEVDLTQLDNAYIQQMQDYYQSIGRSLHVLDITTDIPVPCFVCVSYNQSTGKEILYGFGCHLDARMAVERAVIELNQLLPIVLTPRPASFDASMATWLDHETIQSHDYLSPLPNQSLRVDDCYPIQDKADVNLALTQLVSCFQSANIDLLMLDLTQADIGMPVVKMIAPGLRHFWRRLGAGRLYDVPVSMEWLPSPLSEAEVNPVSIVI